MELISFNSPFYLLIGLLVSFAAWWYGKVQEPVGADKFYGAIRPVLIGILFLGFADPQVRMRAWDQSVIFVVDVSDSMKEKGKKEAINDYLRLKIKDKGPGDRIGIIRFAQNADLIVAPAKLSGEELLEELSSLTESKAGSGYTDIENAMTVAVRIFPENFQKRIVLVTDGNENAGEVANLYEELRGRSIIVDVFPVGGIDDGEVLMESVYVPPRIRAGNPFLTEVVIDSNIKTKGELQVFVDDKIIIEKKIDITSKRRQTFQIPTLIKEQGFHSISVNLSVKEDFYFANNRKDTVLYVSGPPKALFVISSNFDEPKPVNEESFLKDVLVKNGIDVDVRSYKSLPENLEGYGGYDIVILNDIHPGNIPRRNMETLSSAVHEIGVGLVMVAGGRTLSGAYARTPIEKALPVTFSPPDGKGPSSMDIILLIDKSGSMSEGGDKIRLAIEATQSIIEIFGEEDRVGIVAFDSKAHIIASGSKIDNREELLKKVQMLRPGGSTDFHPALSHAYRQLMGSDAYYRHVLLISDGKTKGKNVKGLVRKMADNGISISTVGIGHESDKTLMKEIAQIGKGRFYHVEENLQELAEIFKTDILMTSESLAVEEAFFPHIKDPDPILNGIPFRLPQMHGFIVTSPKASAVFPVVSHRGDPIVGFWRYGLGKASIFTGDDGSKWSRDWLNWEGFGRLWVQIVRRTMRTTFEGDEPPVFHVWGNRVDLQYEMGEPSNIVAKVFSPDGKSFDLKLIQHSSGNYRGTLEGLNPGRYFVQITKQMHNGTLKTSRGGFVIDGNIEFSKLEKDMALLGKVTAQTGGEILSREESVFKKSGIGVYKKVPFWPYLFVVAVMLFLIDVADNRGISLFPKRELRL